MPIYLLRSTFLSNTHLFIEMVNKLSCMLWVDSEMQFFRLGFWTHIHFLLLYNHNLFTIRFVTIFTCSSHQREVKGHGDSDSGTLLSTNDQTLNTSRQLLNTNSESSNAKQQSYR